MQISILGCGWLGLPLAKALLQKGFSINGSTTSEEKCIVLENLGINSFLINIGSKNRIDKIDTFLKESKILIVNIPPKGRENSQENFVDKIEILIPFIEKSHIEKVLFVSSISIYGDNNSVIAEETEPHPATENGKQLLKTEQLLQKNSNFKTTILRFGGLIGEDRHPIHFLSGRKNLENPKAPINLIHQKDCIGIIQKIIELDCWNETFNAVAPFHPNREEYYTQKAIDLKLALPEFDYQMTTFGKIISSKKIENILEYQFSKSHL